MKLTEHSFLDLIDMVHANDRCVECGACIAVCPFHAIVSKDFSTDEVLSKGKKIELENSFQIFLEDKCTNCSICVRSCPVLNWDINKAERKIFGNVADSILGNYLEIWEARATDKEIFYNSQCGGATTALINYAFDHNIIQCAIVTTSDGWRAKPILAFNKKELLSSQKTKYSKSHILEILSIHSQDILNKNYITVFTPCQMHGFHTMRANTQRGKQLTQNAKLLIGTFCYGTYNTDKLLDYLENKGIKRESIIKMEIDSHNLKIFTDKGLVLEESRNTIYPFLMNSCKFCHDFTNVIADISVGSIGTAEDHTTVIIRTQRGKEFFYEALEKGYITGRKIDSYHIEEIKRLSLEKVNYGVKEIIEKETKFSQSLISRTLTRVKKLFKKKGDLHKNVLPDDIHSIYILSDSGVPLYTYPHDEEKSILISGIFGALTLLVNSMSRGSHFLKEVDYSDMKLLLEQREGFVVAILMKNKSRDVRENISKFADQLSKEIIILEKGVLQTELDDKEVIRLIVDCFR